MSTYSSAEISTFIVAHLRAGGFTPPREGLETLNLFESGAIDSLGAMRFAAALEEHFNIALSDDDILSEDFRTIGGVTRLVLRAVALRQAPAA